MSDVSRVEEIFLNAAARQDPAERAAYLDGQCGPNAELRRRVEVLLAALPKVGRFLEPPADLNRTNAYDGRSTNPEPTAAVGDRVGPYKLLEKIGEGGMGEVWVADQLEPIKHRVALKLIKPGMDSRSVLGRFEAERQALAVMDHPNIAKVLDAGTTPDGRPYFVMELVKGTPITEFCDARKLTPKQRLELFIPVCHAIQHAHMKGIIHRDIKPSNVMVELHDDRAVPKVIDFGVAKAIGQQLTEKTIYTGYGALVGTPAYMAPEQASFNALDVDTRADVYALGVLLYELLAGSPPIEKERLKEAALDEVLRIVRDEEPPRPSQLLSTSHTRASIAAVRGTEPAKLSALMQGEIDWIVMKALEKDRTRRYETANGFAADVQRYLAGEQVQAVPPGFGYRLRKAYRRNRAAVRVATAFTMLMLTGVTAATVLAIQARRAEALAEAKRIEAEENGDAWQKANGAYLELAIEAEIRSNSARIDADLLEHKSDPRVGLLRLARPLKDSVGPLPLIVPGVSEGTTVHTFPKHPEFVKLREFQEAAVIAAGQEFVPLVPPLDFSNASENSERVSPDYRRYIGGDERYGLELRTSPDSTRIGTLREGTERVLRLGFSPDGQTAWTQDTDSVVRFWNSDGTFRAKTPLRPERFIYPAGMDRLQVSYCVEYNRVLVADGVALLQSQQRIGAKARGTENDWKGQPGPEGPSDLYSTRTGKFIRRLYKPGWYTSNFRLAANSRWLVYHEHKRNAGAGQRNDILVIVSASDGRELARIDHATDKPSFDTCISPSGKWVMTVHEAEVSDKGIVRPSQVRLWSSADWKPVEDDALNETMKRIKVVNFPEFVTDDIIDFSRTDGFSSSEGLVHLGRPGMRARDISLGTGAPDFTPVVGELGGTMIRCGRVLTDAITFQRLNPPPGRKYYPDLAKLASDGRFWEALDTVTEKDLPACGHPVPVPGLGRVSSWDHEDEGGNVVYTALHIYPNADRLDIPANLLQLWARVVAGGELSPEGGFQPWNQPTWAAKQRELASARPPYADFPFPGLTTDPNVRNLVRVKQLRHGTERDKYLKEWHRLSGRTRPDLGPDTWRTPEVAPKPEPKK